MAKLSMKTKPEKAAVNNSGEKAVGIELYLDQIAKAEPFASLFVIKPEVLAAIIADMKAYGFDPSKPVNVWRKLDGTRLLIDGYTRVRAAEELGLLRVTAYEKTFASEAEALAYAIHTQRDRRNLSDAELLRLIELLDQPQEGFRSTIAAFEANGGKSMKTADITADAIGTSRAKVERARAVLADPDEATAVRRGEKTIHQAAQDAKAKRTTTPIYASPGAMRSKRHKMTSDEAIAEARRLLALLKTLSANDPDESRRVAYSEVAAILRRAL
jgi:ParB family chromosome partitioning protein